MSSSETPRPERREAEIQYVKVSEIPEEIQQLILATRDEFAGIIRDNDEWPVFSGQLAKFPVFQAYVELALISDLYIQTEVDGVMARLKEIRSKLPAGIRVVGVAKFAFDDPFNRNRR